MEKAAAPAMAATLITLANFCIGLTLLKLGSVCFRGTAAPLDRDGADGRFRRTKRQMTIRARSPFGKATRPGSRPA